MRSVNGQWITRTILKSAVPMPPLYPDRLPAPPPGPHRPYYENVRPCSNVQWLSHEERKQWLVYEQTMFGLVHMRLVISTDASTQTDPELELVPSPLSLPFNVFGPSVPLTTAALAQHDKNVTSFKGVAVNEATGSWISGAPPKSFPTAPWTDKTVLERAQHHDTVPSKEFIPSVLLPPPPAPQQDSSSSVRAGKYAHMPVPPPPSKWVTQPLLKRLKGKNDLEIRDAEQT